MEFTPSLPLSVGLELELQLLNAETLDLADGILPLMDLYPDRQHVKPEFIQNTVEIVSKVCRGIPELETHVAALVADLQVKCEALGMRLCGAGSHPFSQSLALITPMPRYLQMEEQSGYLGHAQITFATHVHLGMTSGDEAIAMMRALKPYLPLLIAVSASSPFWRGYDTGYVSYRHRILAASRSYGVPPSFRDWDDFVHFFDTTQRAGLFESVNDVHWDLRPRPHFGTLEIRVMDAQPTVAEAVALASLLRVLVTFLQRHGDEPAPGLPCPLPWWLEKENHFQASRRGLEGQYVANEAGAVRPMRAAWAEMLQALQPLATEMGEEARLERLRERAAVGLSCARQREVYRRTHSLKRVVNALVDELHEGLQRRDAATA